MKSKTIKSILRKKLQHWLKHVDDENVRKIIEDNAICTGGSIASMLLGEKVSDYDFYFKTKESATAVAEYYVKKFIANPPPRFKGRPLPIRVMSENGRVKIMIKSAGIVSEAGEEEYQYFETLQGQEDAEEYVESATKALEDKDEEGSEKEKYRVIFMSTNAITLSNRIQVVIRFYGQVDEIHENYDFVHCTCSWDAKTGYLTLPKPALESMLAKDLQYKGGSKYPLCSIIRTRKFLKREWNCNAGQYVKMAWDLNSFDLSDVEVLEDQMVGVDAAYFREVLELLKERQGKGVKTVDGTYLMQVIDKVFN
ncbi:hypothetical protein LCGC14_1400880 [marine sediment metagenome]|uniref:Uncharacterized protein n=1 Tax=marine sediment metagenome TaxID=412755 RepID=A0A0F9KI41_9ZZZZ